jgi:hypothetical protein
MIKMASLDTKTVFINKEKYVFAVKEGNCAWRCERRVVIIYIILCSSSALYLYRYV